MTPDCEALDRWLDDGGPASGEVASRAHAATCPRCAAALDAARELDALLAAPPAAAPALFTERVMARVAVARRDAWQPGPPAFDWWVRAAAEPSVALALALGALLIWRGDALLALASQGLVKLGAELAAAPAALTVSLAPAARTALWFALLIGIPWASWLLFRWSESYARPRGGPGRGLLPRGGARVS